MSKLGIRLIDVVADVLSSIAEWLWQTWREWWGLFLILIFFAIVLYGLTKPGWDNLAAGKGFFLSNFEARDRDIQECLKSERYTREECILMFTPKK